MSIKMTLADIKRVFREPILLLLIVVPVFTVIFVKLIIAFGASLLLKETGFDLSLYNGYVLSVGLLMSPTTLGAVVGFIMIDDRDESIVQLMSITPMGYSGYIVNRLLLPFILSIVYSVFTYLVLGIYTLGFLKLLYISILIGIESIMIGLLLYSFSDNKVKGLTNSKAMSGLILPSLADLLKIRLVTVIAGFVPFYWISSLILKPDTALNLLLPLVVHCFWLFIAWSRVRKPSGAVIAD